jgi:hypothetical protein
VPIGAEEHVGRLQIAVQFPHPVDRVDALRELQERVAHRRGVHGQRSAARWGGDRRVDGRDGSLARIEPRRGVATSRVDRGERGALRAGPAQAPDQVPCPVDQLHREEARLVLAHHELEVPDEVRVGHVRERAELALELVDRLGVLVGERLERDTGAPLAVEGFVHNAHPARADRPEDLEPSRVERGSRHGSITIVSDAAASTSARSKRSRR